MKLFLVISSLFAAHLAAASTCDINHNSGYYAVFRDGKQFTNWVSDLSQAIRSRNEFITGRVCTLPADFDFCDVAYDSGYYTVTRKNTPFVGYSSDYRVSLSSLNLLTRNYVCLQPNASVSECDLKYDSGYYVTLRDGKVFGNYFSDVAKAMNQRNDFINAGLCIAK